jgi:hypothetical protein
MHCRPNSNRIVLTMMATICCLAHPLKLQGQSLTQQDESPRLTIPQPEDLAVAGGDTPIPQEKRRNSEFVFASQPHPTIGEHYVIITDQTNTEVLAAIQRLSKARNGVLIQVEDLATLYKSEDASQKLMKEIQRAEPKFVAIVPRYRSYRENMLLHLWELLSQLDEDPQLDVYPGLLVGSTPESLIRLIDRSIQYHPLTADQFKPFLISHVPSLQELRSLQKAGILRTVFERLGHHTPALAIYNPDARTGPGLPGESFWREAMTQRGAFLTAVPTAAQKPFEQANLLIMHGHGSPGNSCGIDNQAIPSPCRAQILMMGSCFSASPKMSDLPAMSQAPGGLTVENRESLTLCAVDRGATVVFGHMRLSQGFPRLYPVLQSWLDRQTVDQAYQGLINSVIETQAQGLKRYVVSDPNISPRRIPQNALLYVIIGDPALQPLGNLLVSRPNHRRAARLDLKSVGTTSIMLEPL